ncbi:MAG: FmdB family zinc ribbon protein [Anaerolineae bacterium]
MPTYAYKCEECGISFERIQRFSDEPLKTCPECNGPVHRVICPVGIVFKGSGFYVTDHRNSSTATLPGKKSDTESAKTGETPSPAPAATPASTPAASPKSEPPRP